MKYSLSARILETEELKLNIKNGIHPDFREFVSLTHDCGFDGVNLRFWQIDPATVSDSKISAMKDILDEKNIEVCVIHGIISKEFVERAKILNAKVIQAVPENMDLVPDDMFVAMQMHTGGDFETIKDCSKSFAGKYSDPRIGIFPEPGNLQLAHEKFTENMFLPLKDRVYGWFFQSIEVGSGDISIELKNCKKIQAKRVAIWKNSQLDMLLFSQAIKKCAVGDFLNINEPPPVNFEIKEFLHKTLKFIKETVN